MNTPLTAEAITTLVKLELKTRKVCSCYITCTGVQVWSCTTTSFLTLIERKLLRSEITGTGNTRVFNDPFKPIPELEQGTGFEPASSRLKV